MKLLEKIKQRNAVIGVIGLGYVGLPLVNGFIEAGFKVIGFDENEKKVAALKKGKSYIKHIPASMIGHWLSCKKFRATENLQELKKVDVAIICVPTPVNEYREPDLTAILTATASIAKCLKKEQLIVLESTTYPGTTDEDVRGVLEKTGFKAGRDFYLGFSPERVDPNNKDFMSTSSVPKIVSGYSNKCLSVVKALYDTIVTETVPVSSTKVAEAAKLLENIYRAVNIALVNELKMLFDRMEIDVWEVIDAAKTKPYGFQAFYPGPGLGGHCIPIDPFYLTWKAHKYNFSTDFIELAGEINTDMPHYVEEKIFEVLNGQKKTINGAKILVLGLAYKKDVDDQRESPAFPLIDLLRKNGAVVSYSDPYVPVSNGIEHSAHIKMRSVKLTKERLKGSDLVLLITDHSDYDYAFIEKHAGCIVDTRNAFALHGIKSKKIFKA